jgi:hypothetical protein
VKYRTRRIVRTGGPLEPGEWNHIAIVTSESVTPNTTMTVWIKTTPSGGYRWIYEYYEQSGWPRLLCVARALLTNLWRRFWR